MKRKTSLYLDEDLLRETKILSAREARPMTEMVEEGLRLLLRGPAAATSHRRVSREARLPTALYRGNGRRNDHDDIYA
ncbi:MAG: hypothetical protein AABZ30_13065 [Myxococcota bacterium]